MNFSLRQAVIQNLQGSSASDLHHTITDAIQKNEEVTLPGLGVLFEILWKEKDTSARQQWLATLEQYFQSNQP
ncbi:small acid-soluble spore protein SspI [Massilibacterium senegalense]|uniref:small acid-soluble spore protein SspI n=1 Tax=Massilibacterium senegalense TaxID=1632858 RepID=UPI0007867627|nr:small acid-soluble spore protein SspI [Massilibacterium senegalense]